MKAIHFLMITTLTTFCFISCITKKKNSIDKVFESAKRNIVKIGEIRYRNSFANLMYMKDKQVDSVLNANPTLDIENNFSDTSLYELLLKNKLFKNDLDIKSINLLKKDTLFLINNKQQLTKYYTSWKAENIWNLNIVNDMIKDSISFPSSAFGKVSLIPLHLKENNKNYIVAYGKWYFMNGDMFDIVLFEIRNVNSLPKIL